MSTKKTYRSASLSGLYGSDCNYYTSTFMQTKLQIDMLLKFINRCPWNSTLASWSCTSFPIKKTIPSAPFLNKVCLFVWCIIAACLVHAFASLDQKNRVYVAGTLLHLLCSQWTSNYSVYYRSPRRGCCTSKYVWANRRFASILQVGLFNCTHKDLNYKKIPIS